MKEIMIGRKMKNRIFKRIAAFLIAGIFFLLWQSASALAAGYCSVSQGVAISPATVTLDQNFTISFTLKEVRGESKTFEQVAVAILRSDNTFQFDFAMYYNVTVSAYGTWSRSPSNKIYSSRGAGTYKAVIRGKVGGQWFDFDTTGSGVNWKTFSAVMPDDHGNSCANATAVSLNSTRGGNISPAGDIDYFKLQVPSSGTLTVYSTGSTDTYGYLKNSSCADIESDDDDGEEYNFNISRTVSAGTYYVAVKHYSASSTGSYTFGARFSSAPVDDHGNSCSSATAINLNSARAGNIGTAGDVDYFKVQLSTPGMLRIYTAGTTDTYGYLKNSGCATLEEDDDDGDGNNFYISRSVAAGTYYIAIKHYSASGTGSYTFAAKGDDDGVAEVGVEWVNDYRNYNDCASCGSNSEGFYNYMKNYGYIGRFNSGNDSARAAHFTTQDSTYADAVDLVYFAGHGNSSCIVLSDASACSSNMVLGDNDLEWIVFYACETLKHSGTVNVFNNWSNSFKGLHMILGFHSYALGLETTSDVGEDFADALNDGETVWEAWKDASWDWVASPIGVNKPASLSAEPYSGSNNTVDNDHFWGKGTTVNDPYPFDHLTRRYVE